MSGRGASMGVWTLVRRAVTTHRGAVALLAAVIAVGAFLGAAVPRWANDNLDQTLHETVERAGRAAELTYRSTVPANQGVIDFELQKLRGAADDELTNVLGEGRWAAKTSTSQILGFNGESTLAPGLTPAEQRVQRHAGIWIPDDLKSRVRLIDGTLPSSVEVVPMPETLANLPLPDSGQVPIVDVVTTPEVADALEVGIGDVVMFEHKIAGANTFSLVTGQARLTVGARITGLVDPVDSDDPMWADAAVALQPDLGARGTEPQIITGLLLSSADTLNTLADATDIMLDVEWHVAMTPSSFRPDEVEPVIAELRRLGSGYGWQSGLTDLLGDYSARRVAAEGVIAFAVVSLAALCAALVLLAVRLVAERRVDEIWLARTRGASDVRLGALLALDAAVVALPAGAVAVATAVFLVPGRSSDLSVLVPAALALGAIVALPLMAVREARRDGPGGSAERPELAATRPSPRRLVVEAAVVALAGLGLWLAGTREPGSGVDLVVSLAPVLAAVAAGLVIFRVLPYVVAAVLPAARRAPGITSFLAFTRTARAPGHVVLPVIGMLVAIGVVAFGSTVAASVEHARAVSSWDVVGGDARVDSNVIRVSPREIAAVPGADDVALGHLVTSQRPLNLDNGRHSAVDLMAVDVPAWQRVTAGAPEPVTPIPQLTAQTESGEIPAVLQGQVDGINVGDRLEISLLGTEVVVEVTDSVGSIPGGPTGTALVIPLAPVADAPLGSPERAYFGGDVSAADIAATLGVDEDEVSTRAEVLSTIEHDPVLSTVLNAFQIVGAIAALLAA
ncbi:MAG TPA: hypothetical protein VFQ15_07480, partial [Jiangellaceae bacterium]|nr:hypothetical protein [Jiangellaceae bacterium]